MVSESLESYEVIAIQIVPLLIYPFLPSKETVTTQDLPPQPVSNTGEWRFTKKFPAEHEMSYWW